MRCQCGMEARALQVVRVDLDQNLVEVVEASLAILEERLLAARAERVAVVAVMGAFRTGKSFLMNMFLRFLQREQQGRCAEWLREDAIIPGAPGGAPGFPFGGGQEAVTEGVWIWSEPFVRLASDGKTRVALLLLDSQGAFGGDMTKEQGLTVHGLSTVLASRLVYNIQKQIQADVMANVSHFLGFAQAALHHRRAGQCSAPDLDLVVRDWAHFGDGWSDLQCQQQMDEHLSRHYRPAGPDPNSKLLAASFARVSCFGFSHPGHRMEKEGWPGLCENLSEQFVRQVRIYVQEVLATTPESRTLTGEKLSPANFGASLRILTSAFRDAAPSVPRFREAVETAACLGAKHNAVAKFCAEIDSLLSTYPAGMSPQLFADEARGIMMSVEEGFKRSMIIAPPQAVADTWEQTRLQILDEISRRQAQNERLLSKPLAWLAPVVLLVVLVSMLAWAAQPVTFVYCSVVRCSQGGTASHIPYFISLSQCALVFAIVAHVSVLWLDRGPAAAAIGVLDLGVESLGTAARCGEALECGRRLRSVKRPGGAQIGSELKKARAR